MTIPFGRVISAGDTGKDVEGVKRALARSGGVNDPANVLPVMGPVAVANLTAFQKANGANGLTADGIYGPATHAKLSPFFDDYAYLLYTGHKPPSTATVQLPYPFVPTHQTGGLPGYPAIDVFAAAGTRVLAPLAGTLEWTHLIEWNIAARIGGWTTYLHTAQGVFFLTHFADHLPSGSRVVRGQDIGSVGAVPQNAWAPHIHEGLNVAAV